MRILLIISTSPSATPVLDISTPFVVSVQILIGRLARRDQGGFIASGGTTGNCASALSFSLTNGQLFVENQLVSANAGVAFSPLAPSFPTGSITGVFAVSNGILSWNNAAFTNGQASFCIGADGVLEAVFIAGQAPAGCVPVQLSVVSGL